MAAADDDECMKLPPGFRFHPADEEIITHYLLKKALDHSFSAVAMGEVDLNKCEPWDLPSKAKMGEKEWYFFCQRDRKYPTGMRTNRATEAGYWKATGKDKEIYKGRRILVGMKKTLVFYTGRAPKGVKSNWIMHEYRLEGQSPFQNVPKASKDSWVVCRVFQKTTAGINKMMSPMEEGLERMGSFEDRLLDSSTLPTCNEELGFKASTSSPAASMANSYYSNEAMVDPAQIRSNYFSQAANPFVYLPQSSSHHQSFINPSDLAQLHHEQVMIPPAMSDASSALRKHCKAEQLSNQSMVTAASHEAGQLSPDGHAEISSIISSKNETTRGGYGSFECTDAPSDDLSNIWDYYQT